MAKKSILITGGAGFIGSNYAHFLLETSKDAIYILDKLTYAGNKENLASVASKPNYTFIEGDICDASLVHSLFEKHKFKVVKEPS